MSIREESFIVNKRRAILFACFFLFFTSTNSFAEDVVRIRIKSGLKKVKLKGVGLSFQSKEIFSPYQTVALPRISVAEISMNSLGKINPLKKHRRWQVNFPKGDKNGMSIFTHRLVVKGHMLTLGLDPVPSKLFLYPSKHNRIDVVAELDIDNYLAGVLPSEMPASWPLQALKAQVIASRSYMRNIMNSRKAENYHLEATIHDQVYKAMNLIGANAQQRKKIVRAIVETQGQYLVDRRGEVYRSFYHADCGGETEEPRHVWGMTQRNGTVKDPFCPQSPASRWKLEVKKQDLADKLKTALNLFGEKNLKALLVTQRTASGRIAEIAVMFEGEPVRHISSQDFRRVMGFNKLKSANFSFQWFGDQLKISGKGHGHGVGLCQWGARSLALTGKSYRDILKHYYPYAKVEMINKPAPLLLQVPKVSKGPGKETAL